MSPRICLFDPVGSPGAPFRHAFDALSGVRIAGDFTVWEDLQACLTSSQVDIVAINLDGVETDTFYIVRRIAEIAPNCGVLGVSRATDPDRIIDAMRAGCGQIVRWPIDPPDLAAAIEQLHADAEPTPDGSKRVCIIGSSGGAGSTTLACNLSIELSQLTGQRCALVDMDLEFGEVCCAFDCKPRYSVADVCRADVELDQTLLETVLFELPQDISLLARPEDVTAARTIDPGQVECLFDLLGKMFPFVIVDLPRGADDVRMATLHGADLVMIVTQLSVPFLRNATRIFESLMHMGVPEDRLEIVLNRCNASHERIKPADVEQHFSRPLFAIIPNDYRRVTAARDLGQPILTDAPNSPARVAIQKLARALASDYLDQQQPDSDPAGLLGKFWRRKPTSSGR